MLLARVVVLAIVLLLLTALLVVMLLKPEGAGPRWVRFALLAGALLGVGWAGTVTSIFLG